MPAKNFVLFTTPTCPSCPTVKAHMNKLMQLNKLSGEIIDATTPTGRQKAIEHRVMGVPTVIFFDPAGKEIGRASNVPMIERFAE